MAVRIRKNGRIFCAAMRPEEPGDTYIDDGLHYQLSVENKVLVSEPMERHAISAEWWWRGAVPEGVEIEDFYNELDGLTFANSARVEGCAARPITD